MQITLAPIGRVRCAFTETSQIPKGKGAEHSAEGVLEIDAKFAEGLTDIEGFSHLYVIWYFDRVDGYDLIAHPPWDNKPHGVFSTRSPRRPNPVALTVVELVKREGNKLHVRGVDMLDGTPIIDIKPYLSNVAPDKLRRGWMEAVDSV